METIFIVYEVISDYYQGPTQNVIRAYRKEKDAEEFVKKCTEDINRILKENNKIILEYQIKFRNMQLEFFEKNPDGQYIQLVQSAEWLAAGEEQSTKIDELRKSFSHYELRYLPITHFSNNELDAQFDYEIEELELY